MVYLNPNSGRFWTMDGYEGERTDPVSLHKYLYSRNDPVNRRDPSGQDGELLAMLTLSGGGYSFSTAGQSRTPQALNLSGTLAMIVTDPATPWKTGGAASQRVEYYVFGSESGWILQHIKLEQDITDRDGNPLPPNYASFDITEAIEVRNGVVWGGGEPGGSDTWTTLPEDETNNDPIKKFRDCKGTVKLSGKVKFVSGYNVSFPPWNKGGRVTPQAYTVFPWMNGTPAGWTDVGAQDRLVETHFDTYAGTATTRGLPR